MRSRLTATLSCVPWVACLVLMMFGASAVIGEDSPEAALVATGADGALIPMPLTRTEVVATVSSFVARVEVVQNYSNPFKEAIEAKYVFPLPERAAVDGFLIEIGERRIRGEIKRHEEAAAIYDEARLAGHTAAVLHQERPNIFTQSVANIPPGESVRVVLSYVDRLVYEDGQYRFLFPMVVGTRYVPVGTPDFEADVEFASQGVFDAPGFNPLVLPPDLRSGHEIALSVTIDAGVPIRGVASDSHDIQVERMSPSRSRVSLADHDTIPNKDFMLRWMVAGEEPEVAVLAHRDGDDGYFTLIVQPRADVTPEAAAPKEIIFVLDESGSMSGVPIEMSQRFMRLALRSLAPRDRFNIVRFASGASVLAPEPLDNTERNVSRGLAAVNKLSGSGGTEMLEGFRAALAQPQSPGYVRIVIFLTDGYIGNEQQILDALQKTRGDARIFALGIGSSVNHYLLREMAELGRGAYQYIRPDGQEAEAVERFQRWVTRPYLTDLEIDWGTLRVEDVEPARLPDLYAGQNLSVVGRYLWGGRESIVLRGRLAGVPWEKTLRVELPEQAPEHAVLASSWAREKIRNLLLDPDLNDAIVAQATWYGLAFRLMSPYTSFVAVDESRVVSAGGAPLVEQAVPLPEFVSFRGVFGEHGPLITPIRLAIGDAEHITITAMGNIVDTESTMVSKSRRKDKRIEQLPVIGSNYQNTLIIAPGVSDTDGDGNPNVHGARDTGLRTRLDGSNITDPGTGTFGQNLSKEFIEGLEVVTAGASAEFGRADGGFANILSTAASLPGYVEPIEPVVPLPHGVEEMALRVLADLAEDGRLSASEGFPALAGLLAVQRIDGAFSGDERVQRLVVWALQEAAAAEPDLPWIRDAERRAADFLLRMMSVGLNATADRCVVLDVTPVPGFDACTGNGKLALESMAPSYLHLVDRTEAGLTGGRICGGWPASNR